MLAKAIKVMAVKPKVGPARAKFAGILSVPTPNIQQKRLKEHLASSSVKIGCLVMNLEKFVRVLVNQLNFEVSYGCAGIIAITKLGA
ncbi:uncharacterized protein PHALS_14823 [Plasmopara halstedii]|uniref:Uncharacterized protein n=1 Tax=Plasmopara halstedii TaxID=4781 RepID=A0A0P1AWG1_PLAHL|nr:uncharacterized protein PHALS_14823 [Plasmopara halstedii]CEG45596.1 hypothetical protein PHALS_14823 [Plasmopara halstedii]|eukprot:XP_024581965.1 hypothetical protein PHALS_14823 [Plasmopara halstedii]